MLMVKVWKVQNLRFFLFALGTLNSVVLSEEKVAPVDAVFETTFRCLFSVEEIISGGNQISMQKIPRNISKTSRNGPLVTVHGDGPNSISGRYFDGRNS